MGSSGNLEIDCTAMSSFPTCALARRQHADRAAPTRLSAHDADLRAADVDPRTGYDAIRDYASFPVRIEITDAFHTPAGGSAAPATGFALFETTLGGKWLELLSEIAPGLKRVATMFNPEAALVSTYMPSFERQPGHSRSC